MDPTSLQQWIGRSEATTDVACAGPLDRLAALLDHENPPWPPAEVPPLGHWLSFLSCTRQSQLGEDGHPRRGGFLPPVRLPRRMWAGSRLHFDAPIPLGAPLERHSTIENVVAKSGKSGAMVFVTVRHDIKAAGQTAVREQQDIVYRELGAPAPGSGPEAGSGSKSAGAAEKSLLQASSGPSGAHAYSGRSADSIAERKCDAVELFRFSALTFNAHRIHYDRDYCRNVEGYRELIVHGPYVAMLLMDHFLRRAPGSRVTGFSFRAQQPLHAGESFRLCLAETARGADLWTLDAQDQVTM